MIGQTIQSKERKQATTPEKMSQFYRERWMEKEKHLERYEGMREIQSKKVLMLMQAYDQGDPVLHDGIRHIAKRLEEIDKAADAREKRWREDKLEMQKENTETGKKRTSCGQGKAANHPSKKQTPCIAPTDGLFSKKKSIGLTTKIPNDDIKALQVTCR